MAKSGYNDHTMNKTNTNSDQNKFSQQKHPMFSDTSTDLSNHLYLNGYKPIHKYLDDTIMANNANNGNKTMISSDNNSVLIQDYNTSNNNNNMNINSNQNTNNHHNNNQDISSSKTLNKLSTSSLTTTLARNLINNNKSNSYSNMNGGPAASFRKKITNNNSYMRDSLSHHPNQVSSLQTNQHPKVTAMTATKGQRYMANISNTANLMANKQQQQQPLLNLSILESPSSVANGQQTSPMNISNETTPMTNVGGVGCTGVQPATLLSSSTLPQLAAQSSSSMKMNPLLHSTAADIATIVQHPPPNSSSFCLGNYCHNGIGELLASLALMCILSLLMAFLALSFIQRSYSISLSSGVEPFTANNNHTSQKHNRMGGGSIIGGSGQAQYNQRIVSNAREYMKVFQISVSLSTLTIALDLCCLFVCCIQFLSIIKLLKTPFGVKRSFVFIKKTSHIRVISIGAFLISIPIFFAGVILYTFVNFDEIPALITSVIIGLGIIFCGIASVQNVYLWQWEKTKASQDMKLCQQQHLQQQQQQQQYSHQNLQPQPPSSSSFLYGNGQSTANITANNNNNLNNALYPLELSTLV